MWKDKMSVRLLSLGSPSTLFRISLSLKYFMGLYSSHPRVSRKMNDRREGLWRILQSFVK